MIKEPDKFATLITDGSWSPRTRQGGWAARLIVNSTRSTWFGPVESPCKNSNDAEIAAIGNGIAFAIRDGKLPPGIGLYVQVDNVHTLSVLQTLRDQSHIRTPLEEKVVAYLCKLLDTKAIKYIYAKHIKAHMPHDSRLARHHVHETLDILAKRGRRKREEESANAPTE